MRGEVLHYDAAQGFGFIHGADGNRYTFGRENLRRVVALSKGTQVEFQPADGRARDVFSIREQLGGVPSVQPGQAQFGRQAAPGGDLAPIPDSSYAQRGQEQRLRGTGMWDYFRYCLTAGYVDFRGRARRKEYWSYVLFWTLTWIVVSGVALALDAVGGGFDRGAPWITIAATVLLVLGTFLPGLAVTVRRIHDIGLSGWLMLLSLIPYIGSLIIFVFTLIPSQKHENRWGPVPPGVRIPPPYVPPGYQPIPTSPAATPPGT